MIFTLTRTLTNLFDEYTYPDDARVDLIACSTAPITASYVDLLTGSYERQVNLFIANELEVYSAIERLIEVNEIKCAERFIRSVLVKHIDIISHPEELVQLSIRLCSKAEEESRSYFCQNIISPLSYEFSRKKYSKKLAPLFFDLLVAIAKLRIDKALPCIYRILDKSEFYPWKDLNSSLTKVIQACVAYDEIRDQSTSNDLDQLERILSLISDRAKITVSMYQATHDTACQAVFKWLTLIDDDTRKPFDQHVFQMGQHMLNLIDSETSHCGYV